MDMNKTLVAYFSCTGTTRRAAQALAAAVDADVYEIRPQIPYTPADLDWRNKKSRSSVEMNDPGFRPALADKNAAIDAYNTIFVGFPIWWYVAPTIRFWKPMISQGKGSFCLQLPAAADLGKQPPL